MVTVIRMGFFHLSTMSHSRVADSDSDETPQQLFGLRENHLKIYISLVHVLNAADRRQMLTHHFSKGKTKTRKKKKVQSLLFASPATILFNLHDSFSSVVVAQSRGFTSRFAACSHDLAEKRKWAFQSFSATSESTKQDQSNIRGRFKVTHTHTTSGSLPPVHN